jgi:glutamate racemase
LLLPKLKKTFPDYIEILSQGEIVANSLVDYLERHPEIEQQLGKTGSKSFYTSGDPSAFDAHASIFFGEPLKSAKME